MISLEIGNTYKTRTGDSVRIRNLDDDFRFFGDIVDTDGKHVRIASFSADGRYATGRNTDFDIVEEVSK